MGTGEGVCCGECCELRLMNQRPVSLKQIIHDMLIFKRKKERNQSSGNA